MTIEDFESRLPEHVLVEVEKLVASEVATRTYVIERVQRAHENRCHRERIPPFASGDWRAQPCMEDIDAARRYLNTVEGDW